MEAISHTSVHTNPEVGSTDGFMFHMRVVCPVRTEGTTIYARTLRYTRLIMVAGSTPSQAVRSPSH